MKAVLGKKIGMTQVYAADGARVPVTVVDVSGAYVTKQLATAGQVSHLEIGVGKKAKPNRADAGNYKELGFVPANKVTIKLDTTTNIPSAGTPIGADLFVVGDKVKVTGTTKGKGFQGVMNRWGFHGGPKTHGQSTKQRSAGSIGSGTTPGRVVKGKKMPGHMGDEQQTLKGLKIVMIDTDENLIAVSGALPGANGSLVMIFGKGDFAVKSEAVEVEEVTVDDESVADENTEATDTELTTEAA